MADNAEASGPVARKAARRYLAECGVSITITTLLLVLVSEFVNSPPWASFLAMWLVLYLALRAFGSSGALGVANRKPPLATEIITGVLGLAAFVVAMLLAGTGLPALLIAGAAMLGVWMLSAWFAGR